MGRPIIDKATIFQGQTCRLQNRLTYSDGELLLPSDVTEWSMRVYEGAKLIKKLVDKSASATSNFFTPLRTVNKWSRDNTGYNFEYVIATDAFKQEGGHLYRIELDARTSTETLKWVWMLKVDEWLGSQ